jgi:hypothetical protein
MTTEESSSEGPSAHQVDALMEGHVLQLVVQPQPQLRHVAEVALHQNAPHHVAAQHRAWAEQGRARGGEARRRSRADAAAPGDAPHHAAVRHRALGARRSRGRTRCEHGIKRGSQGIPEHPFLLSAAPSTYPSPRCSRRSPAPAAPGRAESAEAPRPLRPGPGARTSRAHQQVDLLNNVQEHLVAFIADALPPPRHRARYCQRRALRLPPRRGGAAAAAALAADALLEDEALQARWLGQLRGRGAGRARRDSKEVFLNETIP